MREYEGGRDGGRGGGGRGGREGGIFGNLHTGFADNVIEMQTVCAAIAPTSNLLLYKTGRIP